MTEIEAVTAAQSIFSNANAVYAMFITLLSGYLIVAHLSGKNLTSSQVTIITTLYILSMAYTLYAWQGFMQVALHYQGIAASHRGHHDYSGATTNIMVGLIVNSVMVLSSLKYMRDVRHKDAS